MNGIDSKPYVDVLHIAHLVDEVGRIRGALEDVGLHDARVTVFESGISVTDAQKIRPYGDDPEGADIEIPAYSRREASDRVLNQADAFQAQEVIRRMLGALSAAVASTGWHSWMSSGKGNFVEMGLRLDGSAVGSSIQSWQRASWYSYRRIHRVAFDAVSTTLLLPELSGERASDTGLNDWVPSVGEDALVFELVLRSVRRGGAEFRRYVYVLMVDPWQGKVKSICVEFEPTELGQIVFVHEVFPDSLPRVPAVTDGDLEYREGEFLAPESISLGEVEMLTLVAGSIPVFLSSDKRLVKFRVVDCPVAGEVVDSPVEGIDILTP